MSYFLLWNSNEALVTTKNESLKTNGGKLQCEAEISGQRRWDDESHAKLLHFVHAEKVEISLNNVLSKSIDVNSTEKLGKKRTVAHRTSPVLPNCPPANDKA
ncbi:hypothetical protein ACTXT7_008571 [Hymenolepis weldensis]